MPPALPKKVGDTIARWREHPLAFVRENFGVEPDAWQADALEAFPTNQRMAFQAPLCLDEIVPTPNGLRRWGDLQPGETLFAEDGSVTRIVSRQDAGYGEMYRVNFTDGTSLRVTAEHLWKVQTPFDRKCSRARWRTVSTTTLARMRLAAHGQRLVSIPDQAPVQFPHRNLPADPYVFGLWLGDGVANEPRLICPDAGIRRAIVARGQQISENKKTPKRIALVGFIKNLRSTGMAKCRSFEKSIPEIYKTSSVLQRLDLLRGLMDSDGTCALNGHCYLASSSEALIEDFLWLARSLGYRCTKMGPYKINGGVNRDSFRAALCGPICPFLADTQKKRRWKTPRLGKTSRFVVSVEPDGFGDSMCVEVDHPSHCFQATDFIVTHNCKGPGKSALLAWLAWNFLGTRLHPKVAATSITADTLADTLWAEMAKWQSKSPFLKNQFVWQKTRIFAKNYPETWFMSARSWSKSADAQSQADTLAGLHADYIMFLLDEAGGIPDSVMAAAEAALASCKEGHLVIAGNPTMREGPLYRAATTERHLWHVVEITGDPDDPKRSPRISVQWAREQIEKYGKDSPWVLVNVFGRFPPGSLNALIGPDEIQAAMKRMYHDWDYRNAARVLGVDVARFGDDSSVIMPRQGLQVFPPIQLRNVDSNAGADAVARKWEDWQADACFVDNSGGFGAGWIDALKRLGRTAIPVDYSGAPADMRYFNKRAEMYFTAVQWIREGGALPEIPEILKALPAMTYTFKGERMILEPKENIKAKIGFSPDHADSFVQTFHSPIQPTQRRSGVKPRHDIAYDPMAQMHHGAEPEGHSSNWSPFSP